MTLPALNATEERLSREASQRFNHPVRVYRDDGWVCEDARPAAGFHLLRAGGGTAEIAIDEFAELNPDLPRSFAVADETVAALVRRIQDELSGAPGSPDNRRNLLREAAELLTRPDAARPPVADVSGKRGTRLNEAIQSAIGQLRESGNWTQGPDFCGDIAAESRLLIAQQLEEAIDRTDDGEDEAVAYDRDGPR